MASTPASDASLEALVTMPFLARTGVRPPSENDRDGITKMRTKQTLFVKPLGNMDRIILNLLEISSEADSSEGCKVAGLSSYDILGLTLLANIKLPSPKTQSLFSYLADNLVTFTKK
jgi:hypothetical protein